MVLAFGPDGSVTLGRDDVAQDMNVSSESERVNHISSKQLCLRLVPEDDATLELTSCGMNRTGIYRSGNLQEQITVNKNETVNIGAGDRIAFDASPYSTLGGRASGRARERASWRAGTYSRGTCQTCARSAKPSSVARVRVGVNQCSC